LYSLKTYGRGRPNLYAELTSSLLAATSFSIKTTGGKKAGKFNIPGWNLLVKPKYQIANAAFWLWVNCIDLKLVAYTRTRLTQKKISNIHCGNATKMLKYINIRPMAYSSCTAG